jgi:CheY-like chemotaxis protein
MEALTKIMVVEDEAIVAMDIKTRLERFGYTVKAVVSSGDKVLAKAEEVRPDLIVMDIMLEGAMDGISAAEAVRDRLAIPVVFLTAHADPMTLRRAKQTFPYGYVLKPIEERELLVTVEMALARHEMHRKDLNRVRSISPYSAEPHEA